jgi:hypothetical protein
MRCTVVEQQLMFPVVLVDFGTEKGFPFPLLVVCMLVE